MLDRVVLRTQHGFEETPPTTQHHLCITLQSRTGQAGFLSVKYSTPDHVSRHAVEMAVEAELSTAHGCPRLRTALR